MNNISRARFLIKINSFFSGLRLRRLSGAAGGEQGARLKGNDQVARLSKDVATFSFPPGGSRRRWRTGRWTSRTTTTPTRRTRMDAFPRTWISTHSTVKVSSSSCFLSTFLTTIVQTRECANGPGVTRGVKTWPSSASTSQVSVRNRSGF